MRTRVAEDTLPRFLVEVYQPDGGDRLDEITERVRTAASSLTREGHPVRYLRTIFVPEDETCFHLFEAVSADAVAEASRRAAIELERIVEALSISHSHGSADELPPGLKGARACTPTD
jgi:hypothetical protein